MRLPEFLPHRKEAMQAGDSNIEEASHASAKQLGRDSSLLSDGEITRPSAEYGDVTYRVRAALAQGNRSSDGMSSSMRHGCEDDGNGLRWHTGGQDVGALGGHGSEDTRGLLCGFSSGVDDLRETVPQGAMVVDPG